MEQLISAATMPYYATIVLFILGGAFLSAIIIMFAVQRGNVKEDIKTIVILFITGTILLASGFHCKNIYSKYNDQTKTIVKNIIAEECSDATEFSFELDTGYVTANGTKYKIKYQKTVSNEEELVVTVNDGHKNKIVSTLNIPKETKNYEFTNN